MKKRDRKACDRGLTDFLNTFKVLIALVSVFCLSAWRSDRNVDVPDIQVNASSAMIINAASDTVLYEKAPDTRYPPASTAKVMTAILAIENLSPDEAVRPTKNVLKVEPTVIGLNPDVDYRAGDLISAILIKSANDAALVLAERIAGTEDRFSDMMNEKAVEIGMTDTYFVTPSGLPTGKRDRQYTTVRDLTRMMSYAAQYPSLLDKMSKKEMYIYGSDGKPIYLKTHNKTLLWQNDAPWGKTGYTMQARRTFVGIDPSIKPRIVFALLRSTDLWKDIITLNEEGVKLYEKQRRPAVLMIVDWIKSQLRSGRESVERILPPFTVRPSAG